MAREDVPLLERDRELDEISEQLAAACRGSGGLLLVQGPAGIGKTRLQQAACAQARDRGMTVLSARASELERGLPFGVVRSLFEAAVRRAPATEQERLLADAAAMAAPVLGLRPLDADSPDGLGFSGLHGLYWLTANLAESGPLLVAVDDAHWADEPSLRFLVYLLHRVEALPVLLMVTARQGEPGAEQPLLQALHDDPLTRNVEPRALSESATAAVVRTAFSPHASTELCHACRTATAGNPLLLRMLAQALRDEGADPTASGSARALQLSSRVVASLVLPRLEGLSADAGVLARAVAVLGDGVPLRHAAAVAGLDAGAATRAADALATAGLLGRSRPVGFVHPTVRQAVYASLPAGELHRAHRKAAELLDQEGSTADRIAAHLAPTEPLGDDWVVDVLREAARQALLRGAVEEAVHHLERAWLEPPGPTVRGEVLFELGAASALIRSDEAYRYLEQALELAVDVRRRAEIALELARVLSAGRDTRASLRVLERALGEIAQVHPRMRVRLEAEYITVARRHPVTRAQAASRLRSLADLGEPHSLAGCVLLANLAADALEEGGAAQDASRLASAALREGHLLECGESDAALVASAVLFATDELDLVWRAWGTEVERAQRSGLMLRFATAVTVRACVSYRYGHLVDAEADARLGDDVHREQGLDLPRRYSLAFLAGALIERGEVAEAAELLDGAEVQVNLAVLLDSRARLRVAQGRFAEAAQDFLDCGARLAGRGAHHPGVIAWRSGAALSLLQDGQAHDARRLVDEELRLARRLGVPRAFGIALRAAALVHGGSDEVVLLEESVSALARSSAHLEHAKALTDLGAALRRRNRRTEARQPLRTALDLAESCGARPLEDRARVELIAAGARPRRSTSGVDALTPSELRVARMAADGMGNRAIAQALFVTIKTVEVHLGSTYRKLGVPSRADLPDALGPVHRRDG